MTHIATFYSSFNNFQCCQKVYYYNYITLLQNLFYTSISHITPPLPSHLDLNERKHYTIDQHWVGCLNCSYLWALKNNFFSPFSFHPLSFHKSISLFTFASGLWAAGGVFCSFVTIRFSLGRGGSQLPAWNLNRLHLPWPQNNIFKDVGVLAKAGIASRIRVIIVWIYVLLWR
jgi:hypothetical protein